MAAKQQFMTELGVAEYPWLNKPDTKFDPDGTYKTGLRMSADAAKGLISSIHQAAIDEFGKKGESARKPYKQDEVTGEIIFNIKSKYAPKMVDSAGQVIPEANRPQVWGGSKLKIKGNMSPYNAGGSIGVSLQLSTIQIIELAETNGGGGDDTFEPVEGGYVMPTETFNASQTEDAAPADANFDF